MIKIASHRALISIVVLALLALFAAVGLMAQETAAVEPGVTIEAIIVEPENPAADTLCRLRLRLENHGDQVASQLGFSVRINGNEVPVYSNQLFMYPLEPGTTSEMALFNFWSTETSRPAPKDGKLRIEVTLREAQRTRIEMVEGVETWTPLGEVSGLPTSTVVTLDMSR